MFITCHSANYKLQVTIWSALVNPHKLGSAQYQLTRPSHNGPAREFTLNHLSALQPQPLWNFFETICSIPHPSKHEEALAQWICHWANEQKLECQRDKVGNVILRKPASAGHEHKVGVILQAHIDMVPQKGMNSTHDFQRDPIEPLMEGEWLTANDTTLGADNGIGMASCLAVLAANDIDHGPLEVLLTIDEEAGMTGAFGLEPGLLKGSILINTDSEQEGEIYMGCAGGIDTNITLPIKRQAAQFPQGAQITIGGLKGGHSGCDIHLGRGNANKILGRVLLALHQQNLIEIESLSGGSLRNAIPRDAQALIRCSDLALVESEINQQLASIQAELIASEPNLAITVEACNVAEQVLTSESQNKLLSGIQATFNGVFAMSQEVEGVTETSSNLGVITTEQNAIQLLCLIRSLLDSARQNLQNTIEATWSLTGAQVLFSGAYPGWAPNPDSKVMALVRQTYQQLFAKEPEVMVIHAGLECGLFKTAYPELDMVSIGPTIRFPHSPDEKVHVESVGQYWQLLVQVLEALPSHS